MATTASIVVDFGNVENAYLAAELDSDKNGDRTSFQAGENVHFKVYSDCQYEIKVTSGLIHDGLKNVSENVVKERVSFVGQKTVDVQKKVTAITNETWYGENYPPLTSIGATTISATLPTGTTAEDALAIAAIDYTTEYDEYWLESPSSMPEEYAIIILVRAIG